MANARHLFARECRRTIRLIKNLCVLERSRDPFRVQDTEFEKTLTVSGAQMRVRIDRLDALEGGGQRNPRLQERAP